MQVCLLPSIAKRIVLQPAPVSKVLELSPTWLLMKSSSSSDNLNLLVSSAGREDGIWSLGGSASNSSTVIIQGIHRLERAALVLRAKTKYYLFLKPSSMLLSVSCGLSFNPW